ncbi:hypothetical protein [Massilia glaciei]|nr:hypothetical protein [Massilia glaciei]
MQRSKLTMPPLDVDMEQLDTQLLDQLAKRWGLEQQLHGWLARAQRANFGEELDAPASPPEAPTQEALAKSADARARLMARRTRS